MNKHRDLQLSGWFLTLLMRFGVAAAFCIMGGTLAWAQDPPAPAAKPDRGNNTQGSYAVSDIENINLTNGNLSLSIPLASLPPIAGGKLSWTIRANYNSKLWDLKSDGRDPDTYHNQPYDIQVLQRNIVDAGWKIGEVYKLEVHNVSEEVQLPGSCVEPDCTINWAYNTKYILHTPDGSKHELRPNTTDIYSGNDLWRYGFYKPQVAGQTISLYSFDGSYLWAKNFNTGTIRWIVYMPDGTRVEQHNSGDQYICDTNNNKIRIYTETDLGQDTATTHYIDIQTGREIKLVKNINTADYDVQFQTVGGGWTSIFLDFGPTTITGLKYNIGDRVCSDVAYSPGNSIYVLRSIVLPVTETGVTARTFTFEYNSDTVNSVNFQYRPNCGQSPATVSSASNGWGSVSKMIMPSGAEVRYSYNLDGPNSYSGPDDPPLTSRNAKQIPRERVTQKKLYRSDAPSSPDVWSYEITTGTGQVTGPDGSVVKEYFYSHDPGDGFYMGGSDGKGGLVYKTERSGPSTTSKITIEQQWVLKKFDGANDLSPDGKVVFNPRVSAEFTSLIEGSSRIKMSANLYQYDFNGNLTEEKAYDWFDPSTASYDSNGLPTSPPGGASLLRQANHTYYNAAASSSSTNVYAKRNISSATPLILNAKQNVTVGSSQTEYHYDGLSGVAPSIGNLTKIRRWQTQNVTGLPVINQWCDTLIGYDSYGNNTSITDAEGKVKTYTYDSGTHANVSQIQANPGNGTGIQTTSYTYDFYTGSILSQTDSNSKTTNRSYENHRLGGAIDPYGRLGQVQSPPVDSVVNGVTYSNQRLTTKTYYYDSTLQVVTESDLNLQGDAKIKRRATSDQWGRVILTEQNEDGTGNYTVSARTIYVNRSDVGHIQLTSNPNRSSGSATDGWARTTQDGLDRVIEVASFYGSDTPPETGTSVSGNLTYTGKVTSAYYSNETTVTDQAGKKRRSIANSLGLLVRVDEPDNSGNLGAAATPAQPTSYGYDTLGNLTGITQGSQMRTFVYDSLNRLIKATNPESGTILYQYFKNDSLQWKKDARLIETSYTYDGFNRLREKTYAAVSPADQPAIDAANNTPSVKLYYDGELPAGAPSITVGSAKGRQAAVTYGGSSNGTYYGYDAIGRVRDSVQKMSYQSSALTYTLSYRYNLAGQMTQETYPSGRVINYDYDTASRLKEVKGTSGGATSIYLDSLSFAPTGAVTKQRMGNGLWEHHAYNGRLQLVRLSVGGNSDSAQTAADSYLRLDYGFGATASENNGNVRSQQIKLNATSTSPIVIAQTFEYDSLNRLQSFNESGTSGSPWSQTYSYDRYGNRAVAGTIFNATLTPTNVNTDYSSSNNRLIKPGAGYDYDAAGNEKADAYNTYKYNAENRLYQAATAGGTQNYGYDGEGRRITKSLGSTNYVVFVYNAGGEMVAEYTVPGPSATTNGTRYVTGDHLGSTRMITGGGSGLVKARYDYLPFGEEIAAGQGARTSGLGYSPAPPDPWRQKFGSYERDVETGLDFAQARYYSNVQGRFTSPDPLNPILEYGQNKTEDYDKKFRSYIVQPQNWNRYPYVINNPLALIDQDGREGGYAYMPDGRMIAPGEPNYPRTNTPVRDTLLIGTIYTTALFAPAILPEVGAFLVRHAGTVNQATQEAVQMSQGNPMPAPMGMGIGAAKQALGLARELKVAEIVGGRLPSAAEKFIAVANVGKTDIDVIGKAGELIAVGGPAKAKNLSAFGHHLNVLKQYATQNGKKAQAYFVAGTPESVLRIARKQLGEDNVFIFNHQ